MSAAERLVLAYARGMANGGTVDWDELDQAWRMALVELTAERIRELELLAGVPAELGVTI